MEAVIRTPKRPMVQCSGCRQRVEPVAWKLKMSFGECCKHKVPSAEEYAAFKYDKANLSYFNEEILELKEKKDRDSGKGNNRVSVV